MTEPSTNASTGSMDGDLTNFLMYCPELSKLEATLSQFNIFRVLRADQNELRHSNMLAWLFNPDESHGLDDLFLRRWLMEIFQRAATVDPKPSDWVSPIVVDILTIERVEVQREFENIDLLFTIRTKDAGVWVVCIENKVNSVEGVGQLKRYYERVSKRYHDATKRIFILLSKHGVRPSHPEYMEGSYDEVFHVLDRCVAEREDVIGPEPRILIDHYRKLLMEDFMEESEASQLARQIYLRHKTALDFIFENKVDPIFEATNALETALKSKSSALGISMERTNKGYVRFIPVEWDIPKNIGGSAWGPNGRFLVCEVTLWGKQVELHITSGKAPNAWADSLWEHMAAEPFKREWKKRPVQYIKPYKAKSNIKVNDLIELGDDETGNILMAWLEEEIDKRKFKQAVAILAKHLQELEKE